ncbi:MAG TPA: TniQ family protein, partial [Noviherbaspirillum sp.]
YCRIAQENSFKLRTLEVQLWGKHKQIWTRDIDRSIDDQTLTEVATACGTTLDAARETCLHSYEGVLFRSLNSNGNSDWILPAGIYHRKRLLNGMQFCPRCLGTDRQPYFRKVWRTSLATFCDLHHVLLHDCCPSCRAPVVFHRQEMGSKRDSNIESLSFCTKCGFDLKRGACYAVPIFDYRVWNAMWEQLCFLDFGWTFLEGQTFQYSPQYFDALHHLVTRLLSTKSMRKVLSVVENAHPGSVWFTIRHQVPFDYYSVAERNAILQVATWLLQEWPERFLRVCREAKVRHSELINLNTDLPYWFSSGASPLSVKPVGPGPEERAAMRQLLEEAEEDEIKTDWLKRHMIQRLALQPIRSLWETDSLPIPRKWNDAKEGISVSACKFPGAAMAYGLRVSGSKAERLAHFPVTWTHVDIEMDDISHRFPLRETFWKKSNEFRGPAIEAWLAQRGMLEWRAQRPPTFWLIELGLQRFRLIE